MVSPFTFYRGAALPMAADLAGTPVSGLAVQACGDAHLSNFGVFGSAERRLMFDINDFDETLPGPWEWDVKRLAASLEVAARGNGFPGKQRRAIVTAAVGRYRQAMRDFAGMTQPGRLVRARRRDQLRAQLDPQLERPAAQAGGQGHGEGRTRDSMRALGKLDAGQTAGPGSSPTRRCSCRSTSCSRRNGPDKSRRETPALIVSTGARCRPTAGSCSISTSSSTWPARWSASAASAPAAGSS